jgi:Domain of unknown function (DUF4258)
LTDRPRPLSPAEARALIDRLLSMPDSIVFTAHCRTQSHKRRFDTFDIRRVLEHGLPKLDCWDDKHCEWKYKIVGTDLEGDALTLVVVLDSEYEVIKVITGHG